MERPHHERRGSITGRPTQYVCHADQRRLRWLCQVSRMDDGCIPKDVMYNELATRDSANWTTQPALQGRLLARLEDLQHQPKGP